MGNHYHLLIETPDGNLSKGMRQLNGVYTQRFNRKHKRVGHVFQGRYKAILVQKDSYLHKFARYIVLNPVRAEMVRSAKDWPWSSYRATADMVDGPAWLTTDPILSIFGQHRAQAVEAYRAFVVAGRNQPSPWGKLRNQIFLGSERFVEKMQRQLASDRDLSEVPAAQRRKSAKPLEHYARKFADRDTAIVQAYASGGYGVKERPYVLNAEYGIAGFRARENSPVTVLPLKCQSCTFWQSWLSDREAALQRNFFPTNCFSGNFFLVGVPAYNPVLRKCRKTFVSRQGELAMCIEQSYI